MSKGIYLTPEDGWLLRAGRMDASDWMTLRPPGNLTAEMAQAALDVQYGRLAFRAWRHGTALHVERNTPKDQTNG